jgi:dihydrofolate reductase
MRNVIALMHISLDGFAAGPNGEMDWIGYNGEIFKDAIALTDTVDTALYGRITYQMMESYWPTVPANPDSSKDDLHHANWVENVHKIVFSKTLERADWNNTRLIQENIGEEMTKLKEQPGKNMMIFGSPSIVHTFIDLGLIDEYRLNVSPVVLGRGIPLFGDLKEKINLKLLESKTYDIGVVGLHYQTVQ